MNEINGNGLEFGSLKGGRKIRGNEGDKFGEKRWKLSLALEKMC